MLRHPSFETLKRPFVYYVGNQPRKAESHFFGLQEGKSDLVSIAIFDRLPRKLKSRDDLVEIMWSRCEIENYLCNRDVLIAWARHASGGELFASNWVDTMQATITEIENAMQTLNKGTPWSPDTKVTDDFLDPLFSKFFKKLGLPNLFRKTDYHELARFLKRDQIPAEVVEVLGKIAAVAAPQSQPDRGTSWLRSEDPRDAHRTARMAAPTACCGGE